jgi:ribulose-phosphate 3-epimerase
MDAHFVPNMPCGLVLLEQMRSRTSLPFDVHLMVEDNEFFIRELAKIGVQMISVHYESSRHCDRTLSLIRECGAQAGLALNPATSLGALEYLTDLLDFVLVMTVNPGFAGQKLSKSGLQKIADCRAWLDDRGLDTLVEVDGNVSFEHIPAMVSAGADALVLGTSSLFHPGANRQANMRKTLDSIRSGTQTRTRRRAKPVPGPLGVRP